MWYWVDPNITQLYLRELLSDLRNKRLFKTLSRKRRYTPKSLRSIMQDRLRKCIWHNQTIFNLYLVQRKLSRKMIEKSKFVLKILGDPKVTYFVKGDNNNMNHFIHKAIVHLQLGGTLQSANCKDLSYFRNRK